jgi:hypothetical protein
MRFESEDEMLAYAENVLSSVQPRIPTLFLHTPRAPGEGPADSAGSRGLDGVELHARHADGSRPASST